MAPEGTSEPTAMSNASPSSATSRSSTAAGRRFTNFAISFSIISVLAGCFTLFYVGVEQRRADRDLDRLAGDRADHPHGRRQHVRDRLGLPDRGRPVLVGPQARRRRVVVVHRLVQRHRADRDRRLGRLRPRVLPDPAVRPLGLGSGLHQLRRRPAHHPGDLLAVRDDPRAARPDQHLLPPVDRAVHQHLGLVARDRDADHPRDPHLRPRPSPERQTSSSPRRSTTPASPTERSAAARTGSSSCRSASC